LASASATTNYWNCWKKPACSTAHHAAGMRLYSEGEFVQAIEGPRNVIWNLYRQIQQDAQHQKVETMVKT
jgi:hypothetical protein